MPKPYTFPTLYDDLKTISISFLKKHGYLLPNQVQSGTVTWSRSGTKTGSISIRVNTKQDIPYLELDYKCNETPINYRIQLVTAPSNLGKGFVWFFICPRSRKQCRKLYLADTYFYHRSAFKGCMYEKQTHSKSYRLLEKTFGSYFKSDDLYIKLNERNFKKTYTGKPTKKYLKLIKQIEKIESKISKDKNQFFL